MKGKIEYLILFLIIIALSFYLVFHKRGQTHYTLPELKKIDSREITKLTIDSGNSHIELTRKDDSWFIQPEMYPADDEKVKKMIEGIGSLTFTALASESGNYNVYEIDDAHRIKVSLMAEDKVKRAVDIGKTASSYRHTFVKIADDKRIYHARGNLKSLYDKKISDLRDKNVLNIVDDIREITFLEGKKETRFVKNAPPVRVSTQETKEETKGEETTPAWTTADGKPAKENEIKGIISTLSSLQCDGFAEGKTKEALKNPEFTVSLTGQKTYTLSVFNKEDNKYLATSSESAYPFMLSEWKVKKIRKSPDTLLEELKGEEKEKGKK